MARPLRIEYPGACYHVICRGNFRLPVLKEARDKQILIDRLVEFADSFHVKVRAYCLMANHFHGYLQTEEANLGRFMQSFLTSYTVSYNRRHDTAGHVFQGRYKAFLVEEDGGYAARVSRYIHLNPVRGPAIEKLSVKVRQRELREFPWSSYGSVIGLRPCPKWLERNELLRRWNGSLRERQAKYAEYVEQGLSQDTWDPQAEAAAQTIIGSDSFVDQIRRGLATLTENINIRSQSGQLRRLHAWCSLEEVKTAVAKAYDCRVEDLLCRHSRGNEARQALLYLAATHCRGRHPLSKLCLELGPITVGALSRACGLMTARLRQSRAIRRRVSGIESSLKVDKCKY